MKVVLIDNATPRSDGRTGEPVVITVGKEYIVTEVLPFTNQYSIINDRGKMTRHSQHRFDITDNSPVVPLRQHYNTLTLPLRNRIKELEARVDELEAFMEKL